MGLSLFFISPINAQIINGNFSDGLNNWTTDGHMLSFGRLFHPLVDNSEYQCTQSVDFTHWNTLKFTLGVHCGGGPCNWWKIYIGSVLKGTYINIPYNAPQTHTIDTTGINGVQEIKILSHRYSNSHSTLWSFALDNIILEDYEILNTDIHFNPDSSPSSITPYSVTYETNSSYDNESLYLCRLFRDNNYMYTVFSTNSADTLDLDILDYAFNCTYKIELSIPPLPYTTIDTDTYYYIANGSIDPFPDPDPTPDITALPTYTPPPTPIPPDNPITPNNTLNTSWYQGYISLVDGCINGLFSPIYNATAHFMYPIIVLTNTGASLMIESEIIFDVVTEKIVIATSMMSVFFNCLPDKLVYVMIYYLLWVIILLVFKGAA